MPKITDRAYCRDINGKLMAFNINMEGYSAGGMISEVMRHLASDGVEIKRPVLLLLQGGKV